MGAKYARFTRTNGWFHKSRCSKDGELTLPKEILLNIDEDTVKKLSDENNQLTNSQINAYLVFKDEKILLVDSGCEIYLAQPVDLFMKKLQKLMSNLKI